MAQTRRRFLTGAAAVTAGALTGCLGTVRTGGASGTDGDTAEASFFVLADFAGHIAGDRMGVQLLVPFGQHGHGWEPGPDVQRRVFDARAFVYMGEGFQPWADDVVQNLRSDDADVAVIEARQGIDLLNASAEDHEGETESDDHDEQPADDHDEQHTAEDDHDEQHADDHDEQHADEHDHTNADPHFWLDPARATQAVENIAHGLSDVDPANEASYAENATALADRLSGLDDTYRERLAGRTRDTVLVAGHNSFQYLGHRYGFDVEALVGLAPDAEPTPRDVRRAQAIVEEHDIEYVLAPVFESDRAARQLVAETSAVETLPLTPVPSLTEAWADEDWGYVDVMEQVNLPSLAKALGAE